MNNRKVKDRIQRQQARVAQVERHSWAPEIAGFALLAIAVLTSAGFFG
ncbi:MAG: hypothetical protein PVH91_10950 [Pseudomonadales bacterium]|jgi:hypothetical protein